MTTPLSIAIITGSPTRPSRTLGLAHLVAQRIARENFVIHEIHVRDLPAEALLHAKFDDPQIKEAAAIVERAHGVVVASPVYKAAYTGVLKAFLDLLPQFGLTDKVVFPLLTGGSIAHVLALDYGMRPVLQSLNPKLVVAGLFVLDKSIELGPEGATLEPAVAARLEEVTQVFLDGLRAHH